MSEVRLIDANALRKNMEFICMGIMAGTEPYNAPLTEIDNAPTVEEISVIEFKEPLPMVKAQKIVKVLSKRPQGKWIGKEEYDDYPNKKVCECSECGKMICISHNDFPNFCDNCGADMRKGGVE